MTLDGRAMTEDEQEAYRSGYSVGWYDHAEGRPQGSSLTERRERSRVMGEPERVGSVDKWKISCQHGAYWSAATLAGAINLFTESRKKDFETTVCQVDQVYRLRQVTQDSWEMVE